MVRHGRVAARLGLIVSGALALGPATAATADGRGGYEAVPIAGSAYDVPALSVATGLSVLKPRRPR